jgi:ATP synthase, F1 gamma subunit
MPKLSPRDIKSKIAGIKNTMRITNAMKVVSAAKLRKAQEAIFKARPYSDKLYELMAHLFAHIDTYSHPLFKRRELKNVDLVIISADRGLAGAFNTNLFKKVDSYIKSCQNQNVNLHIVGRKAYQYYSKRKYNIVSSYQDVFKKEINFDIVKELGAKLISRYKDEETDLIVLFNNEMITKATYAPKERRFLPIREEDINIQERPLDQNTVYNIEGNETDILDGIINIYMNYQLYRAMLESNAAEHFARMVAMDNATRNASDLIKKWTLIFNKARQESITAELIDIVTAAEAMD